MSDAGARAPRAPRDLDVILLLATAALGAVGLAFVQSATYSGVGFSAEATRQLTYLGVAAAALAVVLRIDYRTLVRFAPWAYGAGLVLLVAVLAFGVKVGGNKAWLRIAGVSLQPAEFMKVATVLLLATVLSRRSQGGLSLADLALPVGIVALPVGLILLQPDTGTAITFLPLLAACIFVSGLRWKWIIAAAFGLVLLAPLGWSVLKPYQQQRVRIFLNPELDPSGKGYQSLQSRISVGSGGFSGQGYLKGPQNRLEFLPERHTDYIFAIIAEEWGFLGASLVLGLYLVVIRRLADAVALARERLGAFLCLGAMMVLSAHLLVNVGMVLGLLPTIGIPLPLLSFGGSSLVASFVLIGLAANVRLRRFGR